MLTIRPGLVGDAVKSPWLTVKTWTSCNEPSDAVSWQPISRPSGEYVYRVTFPSARRNSSGCAVRGSKEASVWRPSGSVTESGKRWLAS